MSSMESNLQELQNLLSNTLNDSDDIHLKLSQVLCGLSFNNNENNINDDIPDLITPPDSHRNINETQTETETETETQTETETETETQTETETETETETKVSQDVINVENNNEYKSCSRILSDNDNFIYRTTNTLLILLLCNELLHLLMEFDRTSMSLFIFNSLMFLFYNSNRDVILETQNDVLKNSSKYFMKMTSFVKSKFYDFLTYFMNYFFSKNTQMIFKFAYNMTKAKVISTYKLYKNNLFNPPLLVQTSKDNVYFVSFYLDGETYKIPIVVPRFLFSKKQQPLMVLNNDEDDVTQNILKYMGPNNDFYGMVLKPCHLGEKTLNFMMEDGSEMNVLENDMIVV
jgi:hypothetical protein